MCLRKKEHRRRNNMPLSVLLQAIDPALQGSGCVNRGKRTVDRRDDHFGLMV